MSTFMANKGNIVRKWYVLDAAGKPLGKTAALAADLLRGKRKPEYTPHADCGDFVIVINADYAVLTGKKLDQKFYRTHSGWVGGLKEVKYRTLMQTKPELAMKLAIRGMLPKNIIAKHTLTRLHIYRGAEHEHAVYDQRIRRLGKRRLEEVVEGSQVRKGARRPTLVQIGRRLQHPAHVQHAHKRSVLRRHRIHRRLPEPRRKHLALPRAPGDPVPPIRQHHRPFPSLQLRPRPNLIALCATVSHRNRRVSFSCLPDRAAIATVERRMRSSATRRALCWPSPSTPYQGSRVP